MYVVIPIAALLFLFRATRGVTDTIKKYERRGVVAGEHRALRPSSFYVDGLDA